MKNSHDILKQVIRDITVDMQIHKDYLTHDDSTNNEYDQGYIEAMEQVVNLVGKYSDEVLASMGIIIPIKENK